MALLTPKKGGLLDPETGIGSGGTLRDDERIMAVIEAAKSAKPDLRRYMARHFELFGTSSGYYEHPFSKLLDAVEALEAKEE